MLEMKVKMTKKYFEKIKTNWKKLDQNGTNWNYNSNQKLFIQAVVRLTMKEKMAINFLKKSDQNGIELKNCNQSAYQTMFIKEDVRHTMKVKMVKKNSKSFQKNKACHESNTGQKISKTNWIKLE